MGKYRDHRQPRHDGFENDSNAERPEPSYFQKTSATRSLPEAAAPVGAAAHPETEPSTIDVEVVWFNPAKGFGFIKLADGQEAYMHASALQAAGHENVSAGDVLTVNTGVGPRGLQVTRVCDFHSRGQSYSNDAPVVPVINSAEVYPSTAGTVRFYDAVRGFGFVSVDVGGGDVFVHATTLARVGLTTLELGQKVTVSIRQTPKGREAASIELC